MTAVLAVREPSKAHAVHETPNRQMAAWKHSLPTLSSITRELLSSPTHSTRRLHLHSRTGIDGKGGGC